MTPVRLRGHHLLCLLTFAGRGYNPAFTVNLEAVAARVADGAPVLVVTGPDDICAPLLAEDGAHCRQSGVLDRDRRAACAIAAFLGRCVAPGEVFSLDATTVARMRTGFASGALRAACAGCEWADFCTGIAAEGFRAARIRAGEGRSA